MGVQLVERSRFDFLVEFAQFAGHAGGPFGSADSGQFVEAAHQTVRRFVEHEGVREFGEPAQPRLAPFFMRQKTFEMKGVAGQSAGHQGWHEGRRSGQTFDPDTAPHASPDEQKTRVADARRASVADQGHVCPRGQFVRNFFHHRVFVEGMECPQGVDLTYKLPVKGNTSSFYPNLSRP